jgi:putative salt-induced outer membrane protein YdiY
MKVRLLAALLAVVSSNGWADRLTFANGDVITGTVTSLDGGHVVIQTEYAARIVVAQEKVVSIETDEEVQVSTAQGDVINGRVSTDEGSVTIAGTGATVALADVKRVTRSSAPALFEAADWSHKVDLAATLSKGNSKTETFSLLTESSMRKDRNEHTLNSALFRDKDDEITTRDQMDIDYGYKRFLANDKWFFGANGEYFRDKLKSIDPRITVGAGAGYRFWENSLGALTVEFGLSAVYEDLGLEDETNPAARWALDYRRLLSGERMEFFHRHQILKILDSDRGEVFEAATGLRFMLNEWWDASLRADLRHETEVPEGSHKTDITYSVGGGVRF